jgi:peptidyl-prolyl cis-trans isomerase SurA
MALETYCFGWKRGTKMLSWVIPMAENMGKSIVLFGALLLLASAPAAAQGTAPAQDPAAAPTKNSRIVERIIARVNNQIVTSSDYDREKANLKNEVMQDCPACTPAQVQEKLVPAEKDLLRDMIDGLLLVQRAKDLGISVETDLIKRLDEIRQQNNIDSMDNLEKAVRGEGLSYEDFKDNIRSSLYRDEVMRREVGAKAIPDKAEVQKYYDEHKQDFVRPESVYVREIFVSTENKTEEEKVALRAKADRLLARVKAGEDFGELAKTFSDAGTAKKNGELGLFRRGVMDPVLEQAVFQLKRNEFTDVIVIPTGFEILQVMEHYDAGQQPLEKVENEIDNILYDQKMKPALRAYLDNLREDSYIDVKPPYVDTAGVPNRPIEEVPAVPQAKAGGRK